MPPEADVERIERFLSRAIELSAEGLETGRGGPFGALIVRGEEVLGEGANLVLSSGDPTAHAEIVAIRAACRRLGDHQLVGCELFTSCEPCPMCLGAIYWARPDRVWYAATREDAARAGFDDAFIYEELARAPVARRIPMRPAGEVAIASRLAEAARAAFTRWSTIDGTRLY